MHHSLTLNRAVFSVTTPLAVAAATALVSVPSQAATITVNAAATQMVRDEGFSAPPDGTGDFITGPIGTPSGNSVRVGRFDGAESRILMNFQLPTLAPDEVLVGADLRFSTLGGPTGGPTFSVDLDAIAVRSGFIQASDFQAASTSIEEGVLFPGVPGFSNRSIGTAGEAALLDFLQNNYTALEFLFLRLTPDATPPENDWYTIFATGTGALPQLTLTTEIIPEPASLSLLAAGLALLTGRRRRR